MNIFHKLFAGVLIASLYTVASANTSTPQLTDKQKTALGICTIAANGVFNIAVLHQSGISQSESTQRVKEFSEDLVRDFGDNDMTAFIKDFYQQGLGEVYKLGIQPTDERKLAFVKSAGSEAYISCLDSLLDDADKAALTQ